MKMVLRVEDTGRASKKDFLVQYRWRHSLRSHHVMGLDGAYHRLHAGPVKCLIEALYGGAIFSLL